MFFPHEIKNAYGDAWPIDGVDVNESEAAKYMATPPEGKIRGTTPDGMPTWIDAPEPVLTYAQELATLNTAYSADRLELCQAWLVAAVADGVAETERKADVEAELDELDAQHAADITELKAKYGVS